jgi:hypothetical protein
VNEFVPSLWGIVVALYAWECLVGVPRDGWALAARGRRFGARRGRALPGTTTKGLLFSNPLPPFGLVFLFSDPPEPAARKPETDFKQVVKRLGQVRHELMPLKVVGTLSFAAIFGALPAAEALRVLPVVAPWAFGAVGVLHVASLVLRRRAVRRLGLHSSPLETLLVAASPLLSLRASAMVAARAFDRFEPLAVGFVLLPPADFLELARQQMEDRPREPGRRVLEAAGVDPAELDGQPFHEDDGANGFCPRCRILYAAASGSCTECGTLLTPLDEAVRSSTRRLIAVVATRRRALAV